jgi:hypothetical protein
VQNVLLVELCRAESRFSSKLESDTFGDFSTSSRRLLADGQLIYSNVSGYHSAMR